MKRTCVVALLGLAALVGTGCATEGRECGPGTRVEGDQCVAVCPSGQRWDDGAGECFPVCAEGTIYNEDRGTCEPEVHCGPGTHRSGNECVPDSIIECGSGTRLDPETGLCVPDCVEGTHPDEATGACMPNSAECITGQVWDAEQEQCVDVAGYCGEGTTWVASMGTCVPDDDLLVADIVEGDGENDPTFGGAGERLDLPAVGMRVIVGGTIGAAEDKDGDGQLEPDYDYYVFSVAAPTLLRITADGVGGASSGFMITSMNGETSYRRYGIGTTSDGAMRDVFLPRAGRYALVASDAMNFVTGPAGPFFGGEGLRYFITIERLARPEGEALSPTDSRLDVAGRWPREAPETGSMLGFYSASIEVDPMSNGRLMSLSVRTDDLAVRPVLTMLNEADEALLAGDTPEAIWGFRESGAVIIVTDYVYWFGVADATHHLTMEDLRMGTIDGERLVTRIDQPGWLEGDAGYPRSYFGFVASEGEVVTLNATTTTGVTLFEVYEATFTTSYGWFQGQETSPLFESDIRFLAQRSGLYVLAVLDLAGASWEGRTLRAIPRHRFNITAEIRRQIPAAIERVGERWTTEAPEAVTLIDWERFFLLTPEEGDSYAFEVIPSSGLRPVTTFYSLESEGPLTAIAFLGGEFPRRFPTGGPVLFGVADAALSSGIFELVIAPIEVDDLGVLEVDAPLDGLERVLDVGEVRRYFRFQSAIPGRAWISVLPAADADLALVFRGPTLEVIEHTDSAGAGFGESASLIVTDAEPSFFEITSALDEPLDLAASFEISIRLTPFSPEVEPNDTPASAQMLTAGQIILGEIDSPEDQDWYALNVEGGAAHLDVETHGVIGHVDTRLSVIGPDGSTLLAFDDDGGIGPLSRLSVALPATGVYYLVVQTRESAVGGPYLLDFSLSPS